MAKPFVAVTRMERSCKKVPAKYVLGIGCGYL
jgi:hypothetical protein